jgi:hypothetical protein
VVVLDNVSDINRPLSDALCRLATGGGLSKRALFTDDDEVLLDARRPVLITAISEVATASDLLDRCLTVTLPPIAPGRRRTEADIDRLHGIAQPAVLGALLDAVAVGLHRLPEVTLARAPRMADFAQFIEAAAPALGWEPGTFLGALEANRRDGDAVALEAVPIGPVVIAYMEAHTHGWSGSATELLAALNRVAHEEVRIERGWPKRANHLATQLRRLAPNLRRLGIDVRFEREAGTGQRRITLTGPDPDRHHRHSCHTEAEEVGEAGRCCVTEDDASSQPLAPSSRVTGPSAPLQAGEPRCSTHVTNCDDGDDEWTGPSGFWRAS